MKWPERYYVGALPIHLVSVTPDMLEEVDGEGDEDLHPTAAYSSEALVVLYAEGILLQRDDNNICHEIIHSWDDLILANSSNLTEGEIQSLGNALQQLLLAVLKANGVDDEPTLEIQRTESGSEVTGLDRTLDEAMASGHHYGTGRPSGSSGSPDSRGPFDREGGGRVEVVPTLCEEPGCSCQQR